MLHKIWRTKRIGQINPQIIIITVLKSFNCFMKLVDILFPKYIYDMIIYDYNFDLQVAYTFDAGPNAVLIARNRKAATSLIQRLLYYFPPNSDDLSRF